MPLQIYKIASVEVTGSSVSNIEFTSIPQGYTDLKIVISGRTTSAAVNSDLTIRPNGLTTNGSYRYLQGNGSTASSGNATTQVYGGNGLSAANSTSSTFGSIDIYIPNYAGSNYKSISIDGVSENNATSAFAIMVASLWSSTSAITSITLVPDANFAPASTATLYGIL